MIYFRVNGLGAFRRVNLNDVKPGLKVGGMLGQLQGGRGSKAPLLSPINILHRPGKIRRFAELDFHENKKF